MRSCFLFIEHVDEWAWHLTEKTSFAVVSTGLSTSFQHYLFWLWVSNCPLGGCKVSKSIAFFRRSISNFTLISNNLKKASVVEMFLVKELTFRLVVLHHNCFYVTWYQISKHLSYNNTFNGWFFRYVCRGRRVIFKVRGYFKIQDWKCS